METLEVVAKVLTHHGVKGQRWGVRRDRSSSVTVSDKRKKLKTSGGHGRPAHADAVGARVSAQIAKKSGHKALSNAELRAFNERLNLEQQAKRLSFQDQSAGKKFVLTMLGRKAPGAVDQAGKAAYNSPRLRKTIRRGATAVAALA